MSDQQQQQREAIIRCKLKSETTVLTNRKAASDMSASAGCFVLPCWCMKIAEPPNRRKRTEHGGSSTGTKPNHPPFFPGHVPLSDDDDVDVDGDDCLPVTRYVKRLLQSMHTGAKIRSYHLVSHDLLSSRCHSFSRFVRARRMGREGHEAT